jgi:hypothetical protein
MIEESEQFKRFVNLLDNRDFVIFAGAGVNIRSDTHSTWGELLKNLYDAAEVPWDPNWSRSEEEFPELAEKIFEIYKTRNNEDGYYEVIQKTIEGDNEFCTPQQIEIIFSQKQTL